MAMGFLLACMLTLSQCLKVRDLSLVSGTRVFITDGTEVEFTQMLWYLNGTGFHGGNGESIDIWNVPSNVTFFQCKFLNVWNTYGVGATVHCAKATLNLTQTVFENCTCSPDENNRDVEWRCAELQSRFLLCGH